MKSSFLAIFLLLNKTNGVRFDHFKAHPEDIALLQWDDKITASAMNDFKLYNMEVEDKRASGKSQSSYADAAHDKNAMSLAEEMMDEGTESSINTATQAQKESIVAQQQTAFDQVNGVATLLTGEGQTSQLDQSSAMMTEEEMVQSKNAITNSIGEKQIKIPLETNQDGLIMGTFFVGSPSKPVRVIFDTGSEHLAIASDMCKNCPSKPYSLAQSTTKHLLSKDTQTVIYGSAKLKGKETQDRTCMSANKDCLSFKFLSLEEGDGLDQNSDGILGLSPEMSTDRSDQHLVWSLMKQNLISRASFSLSLAPDASFAQFGGVDEEQIVGGATGMRPFRNNPDIFSHVKAWALSGKGLFSGFRQMGAFGNFPAVIDTGSNLIAVPTPLFKNLAQEWNKVVPGFDCSSDPNFCETKSAQCDDIEKKLQPVAFLISGAQSSGDTVFEINPSEYLNQAEGKCQFAIAENKLDKFNNKNFILGQLFLRHFYTLYNYENEQIALGINRASEGKVRMVGAGQFAAQRANDAPVDYASAPIQDEPKVVQVKSPASGKLEKMKVAKTQMIKPEKIEKPKPAAKEEVKPQAAAQQLQVPVSNDLEQDLAENIRSDLPTEVSNKSDSAPDSDTQKKADNNDDADFGYLQETQVDTSALL